MATDKWLEYGGVEIVNLSRTAALAEAFGIDSVWVSPSSVEWIKDARGGDDYDVVADAPWYDPDYPASAEFAGIVPLSFPGLDDSTTEASTTEYIGDGGRSGKVRNATLPIVASVALIATTDRGAEYGKRWLDRTLRASGSRTNCSGVDLRYYRYADADAPLAHRRQVRLTRGTSVTRKRSVDCSVTWLATFTLTCDDSYEYGEASPVLGGLGGSGTPTGAVINSGSLSLVEQSCPVYDYSPIFDPVRPALVASPTAPDFLPDGWAIDEGDTFKRFWARVSSPQPSTLNVVPFVKVSTTSEARMVRVSLWPSDSSTDDQCDPLFSVVLSYLPADTDFYIDGEQRASYVWDGASPSVRRADSLVYAKDAKPVEWAAFNDPASLLVTLDIFDGGGVTDTGVRATLALIPKSD